MVVDPGYDQSGTITKKQEYYCINLKRKSHLNFKYNRDDYFSKKSFKARKMTRDKITIRSVLLFAKLLLIVPVIILYIHYFFPQNWGFFIVKPREPLYNIYRVENGNADHRSIIKNNMSYGIGISREGRILYRELSKLIKDNSNLLWKPYDADSISRLIKNGNFILLSGEPHFFKGKFLITKEEQAYSSKNRLRAIPLSQYILGETR